MTEMTYEEFKATLPSRDQSPRYAAEKLGTPVSSPGIVAPNLLRSGDRGRGASVTVVSAPAAVGKSVFAKQISADLNGVYWNLAEYSLGSNFFVGTAVKTYGPVGYSEFVLELQEGRRLLVLDAADEALVRAGRENYEAAIENLADIVSSGGAPSVLLFGRDDTIEDTVAILNSFGLEVDSLQLTYFSEEQAFNFVKEKAERQGAPILAELDAFLAFFVRSVQNSLGVTSWEEGRSFLGYAPVLDALAAFYARESNPIRFLESLRKSEDDSYIWSLLVEVIRYVLLREQDKFAKNFGRSDLRKRAFGASAFTERAQIAYLMDGSGAPDAFEFSGEGEESWFSEVEEQIALQLREHPFLQAYGGGRNPNPLLNFSNPAFRDYIIARVLADTQLLHPAILDSYWRAPEVNPTPMLAGFVFSTEVETSAHLPAVGLGVIHDSHAAADSGKGGPFMITTADLTETGVADNARLTRLSPEGRPGKEIRVSFDGRPPAFHRSISRSVIDLFGLEVRAGDGFADFLIGPNVVMMVDTFSSLVREMRFRASPSESGVLLSVESFAGSVREVSAAGEKVLRILPRGKVIGFPWHRFVQEFRFESGDPTPFSIDDAMDIRRFVNWFMKSSMLGGGLRYPTKATEALLAKRRISSSVMEFFRSRQMIERVNEEYVLKLAVQTRSVMQQDLRDPVYRELLADFYRFRAAGSAGGK